MTPLLSAERFFERVKPGEPFIPQDENGEPDTARVGIALAGAVVNPLRGFTSGVIVAHLPWLLDKGTGEIARPVNPQFADALEAVCADIAADRMGDPVTGSENTRNRYKESLALLEKIDREYKGGLTGPGLLESCVVEADGAEGIADGRFFKKGGMY